MKEPPMTEARDGAGTLASRIVKARPEEVYAAFMDPDVLVAWLPPARMTGKIHAFDARVGGGYRMSLYHPPDERSFPGKTSDREDMVNVRFVELAPPRRIAEAVSFVTTDPAFFGEMTIVITFDEVPGGTEVVFLCENLPPGLRPQDTRLARGCRWSSSPAASNDKGGRPLTRMALTPCERADCCCGRDAAAGRRQPSIPACRSRSRLHRCACRRCPRTSGSPARRDIRAPGRY